MNLAKVSLKGKEYTAYELPILHAIDNINKTIFGGREHLELDGRDSSKPSNSGNSFDDDLDAPF
jgi:hypothetical protein